MSDEIRIQTYCNEDLPALVALIKEADAVDRADRAMTLAEMEHWFSFPGRRPESDCFLAWHGDRLVGSNCLFVRRGENGQDSTIYCWGSVHPQWRRLGLGRQLMARAYRRATDYLSEIEPGQVNFHCKALSEEVDRRALFESCGMEPVRYFVNLARPLNGDLPPVEAPAGIRLRAFDLEKDVETVWRVDNLAFREHWGYTQSQLAEFQHWIQKPHFRPELWFLAERETTGEVVGLGLNIIDPDWIARTGRQEGYVDTLAVLPQHRRQGLGTALLVHSLHVLAGAGMEWAHLHADAENTTGAMRLYERVGFVLRKTEIAYRKVMRKRRPPAT